MNFIIIYNAPLKKKKKKTPSYFAQTNNKNSKIIS
jgi:hypothetical protein